VSLDKTLIYGSILGFEGQVAVLIIEKVKPERLISDSPPKDVPNCSLNGVLGTLPGMIGL
jgi:adenylyltransferase/sulfurtransferase